MNAAWSSQPGCCREPSPLTHAGPGLRKTMKMAPGPDSEFGSDEVSTSRP
jgi:hypothetical protein